jgi:hypothetical protein
VKVMGPPCATALAGGVIRRDCGVCFGVGAAAGAAGTLLGSS